MFFVFVVKRESLFSQYFLKSLKEPFSPKFTLTSCHNTTEKKTLNWRRGITRAMFTIVQLLKLGSRVDGHFWFKDDGDNNLLYKSLLKKKDKGIKTNFKKQIN